MTLTRVLTRAAALHCRVLPVQEWDRLHAIEPFKTRGLPEPPEAWTVLVVERGWPDAPQIVGTCSLFTALHWDCWWIDPDQPGAARGVVLRQLLRGALPTCTDVGAEQVYCGAEDAQPEVADLLQRFGFAPVAGRLFVLRVADVAAAFAER
jgi:hypothetical protein